MKRQRYFNDRKHLIDHYHRKFLIGTRYALLPTFISGKWIWLRKYFCLLKMSAFSFGGQTSISYITVQRAVSVFEFKKRLKDEGIIINACANKREIKQRFKIADALRDGK